MAGEAPSEARLRRRGRDIGLRGVLVDRERELAAIEQALADTGDGLGTLLLIEAPAGKGKSRLLSVAGDLAREANMHVLGAHGSELERGFPFGVAIQLFEPRWTAADHDERAQLLDGPARHAGELLAGSLPAAGPSPDDRAYSTIHGLFWLTSNLVFAGGYEEDPIPLVMLVDDAQWADGPSLRFLAYLADRIADLPVLIVLALRSGEGAADRQAVAAFRQAAGPQVLHPGSLSANGVGTIVAAVFPDAEVEFNRACAAVTNGNPFLLTELLTQLRRDGASPNAATADHLSDLAPESVMNAVVSRLEALAPAARLVARAVAVLGPGAPLRVVAEVTGLDPAELANAADALAAVHLFHAGAPLGFVHPLIAASIHSSIEPLDRGELHRRAAAALARDGAADEQIAVHLLVAPPSGDAGAVATLRRAAARALASGDGATAVRMLERALAETAGGAHPELLAELAEAGSAAGLPEAMKRLEEALEVTEDVEVRARLTLSQAKALYQQCRYREAAAVIAGALEASQAPATVEQLEAAYLAAAFFVPDLANEADARALGLMHRIGAQPSGPQLDVLAHMAIHGGLRGERRAAVTEVARSAWADGALLGIESLDGLSWPLLSGALLYVGELEFCLAVCDAAVAAARAQDSPGAYAAASYCRAWPLYEQGRIADAAVDARAGLDARPDGWRSYLRTAYAAIALCHIQRGALDQAETALSIIEHPDVRQRIHIPSLLEARAQLRLAQHRPEEALRDALAAGEELASTLRVTTPGAVAWRSTAALAKLALGDAAGARELAARELEESLRIDIGRVIVRDLRVLGLAERGQAGLDLLSEAVARGEKMGPRLEHIHALLDLGAALRRTNQRAAARAPLRRALDLAHRGGATALAERARAELAAAGGRPRRDTLTGLESLTPSERRVAELAAGGLTTRQVAEALFVTPKTVEFHLRHTYQKLDVNSREALADALGPAER